MTLTTTALRPPAGFHPSRPLAILRDRVFCGAVTRGETQPVAALEASTEDFPVTPMATVADQVAFTGYLADRAALPGFRFDDVQLCRTRSAIPAAPGGRNACPRGTIGIVIDHFPARCEVLVALPSPWGLQRLDASWAVAQLPKGDRQLFADTADRINLGKLGFFSMDLPEARERTNAQAAELAEIETAYVSALGSTREDCSKRIAALMEPHMTGGVWARSTGDHAGAVEYLDELATARAGSTSVFAKGPLAPASLESLLVMLADEAVAGWAKRCRRLNS